MILLFLTVGVNSRENFGFKDRPADMIEVVTQPVFLLAAEIQYNLDELTRRVFTPLQSLHGFGLNSFDARGRMGKVKISPSKFGDGL